MVHLKPSTERTRKLSASDATHQRSAGCGIRTHVAWELLPKYSTRNRLGGVTVHDGLCQEPTKYLSMYNFHFRQDTRYGELLSRCSSDRPAAVETAETVDSPAPDGSSSGPSAATLEFVTPSPRTVAILISKCIHHLYCPPESSEVEGSRYSSTNVEGLSWFKKHPAGQGKEMLVAQPLSLQAGDLRRAH